MDFTTISVRLRAPLDPDQRVGLRFRGAGDWELHRKWTRQDFPTLVPEPPADCVNEGKLHLCHALAASRQVETNATTDPTQVPTPRGGDVIEIPHVLLGHDQNPFLFRVNPSDDGPPTGPADQIEIGQILPSGEFSGLASARVQIKRFQDLTSMGFLKRFK